MSPIRQYNWIPQWILIPYSLLLFTVPLAAAWLVPILPPFWLSFTAATLLMVALWAGLIYIVKHLEY